MARRKKNRRPVQQLECTCDMRHDLDPPKYADHDGHCDLWALEDFMNGLLDWDPVSQRLEKLYPADPDTWGDDVPMGDCTDLQRIVDATVSGYGGYTPGAWKPKGYVSCRHNLHEVKLPDELGTTIYCSGSMDARAARWMRPDWAVYLCHSWTAKGLALFIPWEDYGTPRIEWQQVRWAAVDVYRRALAGQRVEIGCMGGHGRTGTFLACLVMLADPNMTPEGAKDWVRANYCFKAIEDESQLYFLRWFSDPSLAPVYVHPKPEPKGDVTVIGPTPKGSGSQPCNWSRNKVPCCLPLGHDQPHLYPVTKGGITLAEALAQADQK